MATSRELLAALQAGGSVSSSTSQNGSTIIVNTNNQPEHKSDCTASGPTDASVVDQMKVGGKENCQVQFDITNTGEGATARVFDIGGGLWYTDAAAGVSKRVSLGLPDNGFEESANVTTNFGSGPITFGGSLNAFDYRTEDGLLTTGMCIEVNAGVQPRVTLVRIDAQGDICSKIVQKPICPACPQDDGNDTFCYEFCRIIGLYNWIEVTLPIGSDYTVTLNTDGLASANPIVPC